MSVVTSRIIVFVIVASGISMLADSAMAITMEQANAECERNLAFSQGMREAAKGMMGRTDALIFLSSG
jgi:uncharacterized protein YdbL (DUF1318 family)